MGFVFECLLCAGSSRDRPNNVEVEILVSQNRKELMREYHRRGNVGALLHVHTADMVMGYHFHRPLE
jgi:hypothetical protein